MKQKALFFSFFYCNLLKYLAVDGLVVLVHQLEGVGAVPVHAPDFGKKIIIYGKLKVISINISPVSVGRSAV